MPIKPLLGCVGALGLAALGTHFSASPEVLASVAGFSSAMVGALAGNIGANHLPDFLKRCGADYYARYVEGFHGLDANYDVARGVRRAMLKATESLVVEWRRAEADRLSAADRAFADRLLRWCGRQEGKAAMTAWAVAQDPGQGAGDVTALRSAFDDAFWRDAPAIGPASEALRARAVAIAHAEAVAGADDVDMVGLLDRIGSWPFKIVIEPGVAASFGAAFRGQPDAATGWFGCFLHALNHELKQGKEFQRLWLAATVAGVAAMVREGRAQDVETAKILDGLDAMVRDLAAGQSEILDRLRAADIVPMDLPDRPQPPEGEGLALTADGTQRFVFANRWTPFLGREQELDTFARFCDLGAPGLRYALVHGRGGEGKSRLALEACWRAVVLKGYDAGFLRRDERPASGWRAWRLAAPTLIVVDYAAGRVKEVRGLLAALARDDLAYPVRVLLLDRTGGLEAALRDSDLRGMGWAADLWRGLGSIDQKNLRGARFAFELALRPPEDPLPLMAAVFALKGVVAPPAERCRMALHSIDPEGSALFAVLVADALAEGEHVTEEERYEFLVRVIERPHLLDDLGPALRETVYNVAAWATLTRGLTLDDVASMPAALTRDGIDARDFIPPDDDIDAVVAGVLRLTGGGSDGTVPPLEPDLLGEALVLSRAGRQDGAHRARRRVTALRELAWRTDRRGTSGFHATAEVLNRLSEDFPRQPGGTGWDDDVWLVPPVGGGLLGSESYYALVSDVVLDRNGRDGVASAISLYAVRLKAPALLPGAPAEVRVWRARVAYNLSIDIVTAADRGVGEALAFYASELRAPAEAADAPAEVRLERAKAAFNLSNDIRTAADRGLGEALAFYALELRAPAEAADASAEVQVERAKAACNLTYGIAPAADLGLSDALVFYASELRVPAEAADAPAEVRVARARAAFSLMYRIATTADRGLGEALTLYESELGAPAEAADAPAEVRVERARAAFTLSNNISTAADRGLGEALAFYVTELRAPAEAEDAPAEVRVERAKAAVNLSNDIRTATDRGLGEALAFYASELRAPVEAADAPAEVRGLRARAALNLSNGIAAAADRGLGEALAFYITELRAPAASEEAPAEVRVVRAMAAFNLLGDIAAAGDHGLGEALAFYMTELRAPAEAADAPAEVRVLRARAALTLSNGIAAAAGRGLGEALDFYARELRAPAREADAPKDLAVVRAIAAFALAKRMNDDAAYGPDFARAWYETERADFGPLEPSTELARLLGDVEAALDRLRRGPFDDPLPDAPPA